MFEDIIRMQIDPESNAAALSDFWKAIDENDRLNSIQSAKKWVDAALEPPVDA